ncbi:hypothetical protein FJZ39_04365 [Candidatus Saccharibacteria bacterium]|nr:hypothetical protein [Candidatus Saccharibacteria bacterium]
MTTISKIIITYNPVSTGPSKKNALSLRRQLAQQLSVPIKVIQTTHVGHNIEIGKKHSHESETLLLSSSGDGAYNELINGVLSGENKAITAVIPSGNANDHYSYLYSGTTLIEKIVQGSVKKMDALQLETATTSRYAHSYIGFGLTPDIGKKLTETKLTPGKEIWLVLRHLFSTRDILLTRADGRKERYDSLVFSNIGKMSKFLKLSTSADVRDGLMEINKQKDGSWADLIRHLLHLSIAGNNSAPKLAQSTFRVRRDTAVQLDGEVLTIPSGTQVQVFCRKRILRTIL